MHKTYLGQSLTTASRTFGNPSTIPGPTAAGLALVIPLLALVDLNAEPVILTLQVPDYGPESAPLVSATVKAIPLDAPRPADEAGWAALEGAEVHSATIDLEGAKGRAEVPISGLPDGAWFVQTILVADFPA